MCQQFFSIFGQLLDVAGFLLIAFEWKHSFERDVHLRKRAIEEGYEKNLEYEETGLIEFKPDEYMIMWHEFQRLLKIDTRFRQKLFYWGVCLVVAGFAFQVLGNLPGGIFGVHTCPS